MADDSRKFETWAIVEVMGHRQFAGLVTEQAIGGASFVRVDVPAVKTESETLPAFTKILGAGSIYAISPCSEETARAFAAQGRQRSFSLYDAPRLPAPAPLDRTDRICRGCGNEIDECDCDAPNADDYYED